MPSPLAGKVDMIMSVWEEAEGHCDPEYTAVNLRKSSRSKAFKGCSDVAGFPDMIRTEQGPAMFPV